MSFARDIKEQLNEPTATTFVLRLLKALAQWWARRKDTP